MTNIKVKNVSDFTQEIEHLVQKYKLDYMDAVLFYAEQHGLEIETVASIIRNSTKIKSKIQIQAEELNFLPKTSRLPL
jgi:hypothetical protein